MLNAKYTPESILQILKDFYNFQSVFDPEVDKGEELSFKTPIWEWMSICDLVEPGKLTVYYQEMFKLATPAEQLNNILKDKHTTLAYLCAYIAANAPRPVITPVTIMGAQCETAAIFKMLMKNLSASGVDTNQVRPGSLLDSLFNRKHAANWLQEVSKIAPGSLTHFVYEPDWITRMAGYIMLLFLIGIITIPLIWRFYWYLLMPLVLSIVVLILGERLRPGKLAIGGYETVRDLIKGMQNKINETC